MPRGSVPVPDNVPVAGAGKGIAHCPGVRARGAGDIGKQASTGDIGATPTAILAIHYERAPMDYIGGATCPQVPGGSGDGDKGSGARGVRARLVPPRRAVPVQDERAIAGSPGIFTDGPSARGRDRGHVEQAVLVRGTARIRARYPPPG